MEDSPSENYCDFTVIIGNGNEGLIAECTTMDTEISFNQIQYTNNIDEMMKYTRFERAIHYYTGPEFSTLDERVQTSMSEYMAGYGVNEHLAAFVECMSLDKD